MAHKTGFKLKVAAEDLEHFRRGAVYLEEVPKRHKTQKGDTVDWRCKNGAVGTAELTRVVPHRGNLFVYFKWVS